MSNILYCSCWCNKSVRGKEEIIKLKDQIRKLYFEYKNKSHFNQLHHQFVEPSHYQNINAYMCKEIHGNNTVVQGHFVILYRGEQIQMLQDVTLQEILDLSA